MQFSIDLISDLNINKESFDWIGKPTSLFCLVAGNVSSDRTILLETLQHLGRQYKQVFFIDGPQDMRHEIINLKESYKELEMYIPNLENIVYGNNQVVMLNNVAIVLVNGWWSYDFDNNIDIEQVEQLLIDEWKIDRQSMLKLACYAYSDTKYLENTIRKLQSHKDVKEIIIVSSTVPLINLISHDIELASSTKMNLMGSSMITSCLSFDTEQKVKTWCFGYYPHAIDEIIDGIRFVSNPRSGHIDVYYPKIIRALS